MEIKSRLRLPITEPSHTGDARRQITALAQELNFNEVQIGQIALVVTELTGNLIKHTQHGGEILISTLQNTDNQGLEILAIDQGPGIRNVQQAMNDGFSTAGTAGTGLGAIRRLSNECDIYSDDNGTVILSRFWRKASRIFGDSSVKESPIKNSETKEAEIENNLLVGAVNVAMLGESVPGDDWAIVQQPEHVYVLVADGLGHGVDAAYAAGQGVKAFLNRMSSMISNNIPHSSIHLAETVHLALRGSRGAAIAIAEIDLAQQIVHFTGIGNISGAIFSATDVQRMVSHNGTAGHEARRIQEFTYRWMPGAVLIMHSDGCHSRWNLAHYPGLRTQTPSLMAGVIYRDATRGRDDATVVVVK